jgi:hypothetical protein
LLKSTSFGAWRYKLDLYSFNPVLTADQWGPFVSDELAAHVEKTMRWQWGPSIGPLKIKNKEEKIFLWHDQAKIFFYKLLYVIFMKNIFFREYVYMISMHVQIFRNNLVLFWAIKKKTI